jgi:acyl dehydratase
MFGGLISGGFMSIALTFALFYQSNAFKQTGVGTHGIVNSRWIKPVRPDDTSGATMESPWIVRYRTAT